MADVSTNPGMRERRVKTMADYQFGKDAGGVLFEGSPRFILSRTKRIRQVYDGDERLVTIRAKDGFFTLGMEGARRLHGHFPKPALRIVVAEEAVPFVSAGKTAFAKHVLDVDPSLRAGDEVLLTDENDTLIATGQLLLAPAEVMAAGQGPAVNVRSGILKEEKD